jgi:low affinity Fe/Cu permease
MSLDKVFAGFANRRQGHGQPLVFACCCVLVILWAASGPVFGFSDTWQLVINTSTTIITFLMVFLIQNTQNRDTQAIQLKLDELSGGPGRERLHRHRKLTDKELTPAQALRGAGERRESGAHAGGGRGRAEGR